MNKKGKGFIWFAINGKTDYCKLSRILAESIKSSGTVGEVAVITNSEGKEQLGNCEHIDHIIEIQFDAKKQDSNFGPEYSVFDLTPFVHTIKLEADMLITQDIGWWWHILCQHDLVLSVDCFDYKERTVKDTVHRRLFIDNRLPNVYNGLSYFRYSREARSFFAKCKSIFNNWQTVKEYILKNCHDEHASTDVVYALAYKMLDPTCERLLSYDFFKMIHYKNRINNTNDVTDMIAKHQPFVDRQKLIIGQHSITKPFHYHHRDFTERMIYEQ
jgi:hypothetical protein